MDEQWRAVGMEAARCLQEGQYEEAVAGFSRLTELRPDHADSWFNLGYAQRLALRYEDALRSYGRAIDLGMRGAEEAHLNRAVILADCLYRTAEAKDELDKALAKNSSSLPAWLNLGNLHEELGDAASARAAYESALGVSAGCGRAHARLANLMARDGDIAGAVDYLNAAAKLVRPMTEDAAEICFAMASFLDSAGNHVGAFTAAKEGNSISLAIRPGNRRYDRSAQERLVDSIIAAFPFATEAAPGKDDDKVIFICGMFRSGSTLAEQIIARHPQVESGGELEFIPAMVRSTPGYPVSLKDAPDVVASMRDTYRKQVGALFPNADRVTDKRPNNFLHLGLIKQMFPGAKVILTEREALDNILSVYFLFFAEGVSYSESLDDIAHYYEQYRRLAAHWRHLYGADIHTVNYDRLVTDSRDEVGSALEFLGLPWDEACLQPGNAQAVRTASNWQVRQPLHARSSGRWRNYAQELASIRSRFSEAQDAVAAS